MKIFEDKNLKVTKKKFGKDYIEFEWGNMYVEKEKVVEAHTKAADVAQKEGISTYVANVKNASSVLRPEVVAWWSSWSAFLQKIGIKKIITIKKDGDALRDINDKTWQRESINVGGIEHVDIPNEGFLFRELNK